MTNQPHLASDFSDWVSKQLGKRPALIEPLAGDGSTRRFFRVKEVSGRKHILLSDPGWKFSADYPSLQGFLKRCSIPVPEFGKCDPGAGLLLMEDLGDELLQLRIQSAPEKKEFWLGEAIGLLAKLHSNTFPVPTSLPVATRHFDTDKYSQELGFTLEHLYEKFLGNPHSKGSESVLRKFSSSIVGSGAQVFCHRDYHCRNLLVHQEKLWLIDFQDARMGTMQYDLASLVYDAYLEITDTFRKELIKKYQSSLSAPQLKAEAQDSAFSILLARVAYQRVMKAAGSFASFYTRFGKSTHLQYLVPALESAVRLEAIAKIEPELSQVFSLKSTLDSVSKRLASLGVQG